VPHPAPDERRLPPFPTRRAVLGLGALAAGSLGLAACGIRLEDDAPRVPLVPARDPIPGEAFLIGLWQSSGDLATQAAALGGAATSLPARLAAIHRSQYDVLHAELLRLGVPQRVLDEATRHTTASSSTPGTATAGSATSAGSATGGPTAPSAPQGGVLGLAAAEAADLGTAALSGASSLPASAVPLASSALAQRSAAATLLGAPVEVPEPTWRGKSLAASFLETTRSAVYGFEVVAAQSPTGAQHTLARTTLAQLQARGQTQTTLAGDAAGPPALGYPLPFRVTTPSAARRLAVNLVTELRAALARDLGSAAALARDPGATDHGDTAPLASVVDWLADTEVLASRWGVALEPFPGLQ
jgi:hypothetical protein